MQTFKPQKHEITVDGQTYQFTTTRLFEDTVLEGEILVHAPGVVPFTADDLEDAKAMLFNVYSEH